MTWDIASLSWVTIVQRPIVSAEIKVSLVTSGERETRLAGDFAEGSIDEVCTCKFDVVFWGHALDIVASIIAIQYVKSIFRLLLPAKSDTINRILHSPSCFYSPLEEEHGTLTTFLLPLIAFVMIDTDVRELVKKRRDRGVMPLNDLKVV